ncbi:MAG: hypothetical protein QHH05_05215 [Syntrophomonadaceae bacterium]|jgi:hypothetical protein|nr:hypothetical protein [Syntrophomonadaceae bacterium]
MTIRTVDLQVMLPRVSEVSRVQHVQQHDHENRQQEFVHQLVQQGIREQTTVQRSPRGEEARVRERQEREGEQKKRQPGAGNERERENKEQQKAVDLGPLGHTIDLRA